MAVYVATDTVVTLAATDWSDWVTSAELQVTAADVVTTAMGSSWETRIAGIKSYQLMITWNQDFVDNGLDETLWGLLGTSVAFTIKPTSAATGAANPVYSGSVLVTGLTPISGSVGALAAQSVTWPGNGALARATS